MNVTAVNGLGEFSKYGMKTADAAKENRNASFESMFQAAKKIVNDANHYTNKAAEAEMAYALGITDNTHELQVAQQKANLALQYTIAVRNHVLDAYKEIMNMQF